MTRQSLWLQGVSEVEILETAKPRRFEIGFGGPFITVGTGIQIARQAPIETLTPLGKSNG